MLKETLPKNRSEYIPTLDGWRAVAICLVLLSHGFTSHQQAFGQVSLGQRIAHAVIARSGAAGVILFFSISGFLICTRLLSQRARDGRILLRDFYIRRAFRILPPAFTYLLVVAILFLVGLLPRIINTGFHWHDWLSAIFFFTNYQMQRDTFVLSHFWSLAVEEQFYLFWPAMLVVLGNRKAAITAFSVAACAILWRLLWLKWTPVNDQALMLQRTDVRLDSFMIPCFLAIIFFYFRGKRIVQYAANPMAQWAVLLSFFILSFAPQFIHSTMFMERAFVPLLITLVVIGTVINPYGWLGRILETPGLRWIGRLSYSIYLWQEIVIYRQAPPQSGLGHIALLFLLRLPILFALAIASYYWIEVPFIRLGRRLVKRASAHLGNAKAASAVSAAALVE